MADLDLIISAAGTGEGEVEVEVPRKLTQDVDFSPQLKQIISRQYSESPDNYLEELSQLNRSRQDALRGSAGSDLTARDLLYKYFGQLELLELRFPDLRVPFPWNDAFTHVKISQLSLAYEKASVIFNIAATLSSLAASSPRSSPEGLKRAFLSFRCASGMFTYINDNFLHAPSTDLSREVVKVLVALMGAQATEVFIETMAPGSKNAGLKSKLCMQASGLYAGIVEEVKEWVAKGVFVREWSLLIQTKAKYFASLAHYHRSLAETQSSKYGAALAHLTISETLSKESFKLAQTFSSTFSTTSTSTSLAPDAPTTMLEMTKQHSSLMVDLRAKAQKDNDLVYNDFVPTESSLTAIEPGKPVAEPIPIHDVYATPDVQKIVGPDLFAKLVPLSVHESASLYSEEKAKLVRAESDKSDLADGELVAALEFMGLPGSLDRFRTGGQGIAGLTDPGRETRGWGEEIRREESGGGRTEDLLNRLVRSRDGTKRTLDELGDKLDVESRECELQRAKFGHLWEQQPSVGLTRGFRSDIKSHRESLELAGRSDAQALGLWDEVRRDVDVLREPSGRELERVFVEVVGTVAAGGGGGAAGGAPSLLDVDDSGDAREEEEIRLRVERISEALAKVNKIKKERLDVLKDLKERVQGDDISHLLILNRKGSAAVEPTLFATELEKFRPHQTRISSTLHHQQTTLTEISNDFKALSESKKARDLQSHWGAAEAKKRELVNRFNKARDGYFEVREGVQRGVQFYQDLGELVDGLVSQVNPFLMSRDKERNMMASSAAVKQRLEGPRSPGPTTTAGLERGLAGMSLGGPTSPPLPPAAPTPPQWGAPPQAPSPYGYPSSVASPPVPPTSYAPPQPPAPPVSSYAAQSPSPYAPPQPPPPQSGSPYGAIPTSGAFSLGPPQAAPSTTSNPYGATATANPYSSGPPPPPLPPSTTSYNPYAATQQYQPAPPQPQRQTSLPPPPPPTSTSASSYLPPPPAPVSYGNYGQQAPKPPAQQGYYNPYAQQQQPQQPPQPPQGQKQVGVFPGYPSRSGPLVPRKSTTSISGRSISSWSPGRGDSRLHGAQGGETLDPHQLTRPNPSKPSSFPTLPPGWLRDV
ncbi:BRO1-domain-containing protein [Meredithblackwellia eburnea MCA 4105]